MVNVEGQPFDPGMAATPLNIEDFEVNDTLEVEQMLGASFLRSMLFSIIPARKKGFSVAGFRKAAIIRISA